MTGAVGLEIKGVLELETKWEQQCRRWWPSTSWFEDERGNHMEEWELEWILTEENDIPGSSHVVW